MYEYKNTKLNHIDDKYMLLNSVNQILNPFDNEPNHDYHTNIRAQVKDLLSLPSHSSPTI